MLWMKEADGLNLSSITQWDSCNIFSHVTQNLETRMVFEMGAASETSEMGMVSKAQPPKNIGNRELQKYIYIYSFFPRKISQDSSPSP
jgi:hypothetical protein